MKLKVTFEFDGKDPLAEAVKMLAQLMGVAPAVQPEVKVALPEAEAPTAPKRPVGRPRKNAEAATAVATEPKGAETPPAVAPASAPAAPTTKVTSKDLEAKLTAVFEKHGMDTAMALLARRGVKRLSDIKPDGYAAFLADADEALNGADPMAAAA